MVLGNPDGTPDDLRGMVVDVRTAVDRAERLVAALLLLARNERGLTVRQDVDLGAAAEDVLGAADIRNRRVHAAPEP